MKIFIDDVREAPPNFDVTLRSSQEAILWMTVNGIPDHISFDHDLGGDDTAMRIVHWMIDVDLESEYDLIPNNFTFQVHSANPVGAENIAKTLQGYLKFRNE